MLQLITLPTLMLVARFKRRQTQTETHLIEAGVHAR